MLCGNCSDLDLVAVIGEEYKGNSVLKNTLNSGAVWVARVFGPSSLWAWAEEPGCEFCTFISSAAKTHCELTESPKLCHVRFHPKEKLLYQGEKEARKAEEAFQFFELVFSASHDGQYSSILGTVAFGSSDITQPTRVKKGLPTIRVREVQPLVQLSSLKNLVHNCSQEHAHCRRSKYTSKRSLNRLRVIDCSTRHIVPASNNVQYAALSYQWGANNSKFEKPTDGRLPPTLPLTVKDAMTVTLGLGLQYLWIDAYCIIQDDVDDFQHQIQQMDLVYHFAHITIIAANGTGSDSGLSGISSNDGRLQTKATFRGIPLLTFSLWPWSSGVFQSSWYQRGWTYQESFFSRRRLIFGSSQVIFDCDEQSLTENLVYNPSDPKMAKWHSDIPQWHIYRLVEQFSSRNLSFQCDILNAFEGVLQSFSTLAPSVKSYWGIPILRGHFGYLNGFLLGLCWSLDSQSSRGHRRRGTFPSWSWAGWMGRISFPFWDTNLVVNRPPETMVYPVMSDHSKTTWSHFESRATTHQKPMASQNFWLSALSFKVILRKRAGDPDLGDNPEGNDERIEILLSLDDRRRDTDGRLDCRLHDLEPFSVTSGTDMRTCFAIYLFSRYSFSTGFEANTYSFLLVSRKKDCWERVGLWMASFGSKEEGDDFENWVTASPSFEAREFCMQ